MSEASVAARAAMKAKAKRLCEPTKGKVDATSAGLPEAFEGGRQNQPSRPVPRAYKSGGKVHGEEAKERADRMPRKKREEGGKTDAAQDNATTSAEYRKRLEAAQSGQKGEEASERKSGGRAKKMGGGGLMGLPPNARAGAAALLGTNPGGVPPNLMNFAKKQGMPLPGSKRGGEIGKHSDEAEDKKLIKSMVKKEDLKGRTARKHGGRTGKTAVNIIIAPGKGSQDGQQMAPGGAGPAHPLPPQMQPPMPPPGAGGPPPMPPGPPPGPPMPPMGRKSGGRTYPIDTGSLGGVARLDKVKAYGLKPAKG